MEVVIKLFNDYSSVVSEAKFKTVYGKGTPTISARVARGRIARIANVSNCNVSNHSNLKILSPKQMLQRLPIEFALLKAGNTPEILTNEIRKIIYSSY